jgi:hypothetical protein
MSCGGNFTNSKVVQVQTGSGPEVQRHLWTTCEGGCPCSGLLIATEDSSVAEPSGVGALMQGTFQNVDCTGPESGTFQAVRVPFEVSATQP